MSVYTEGNYLGDIVLAEEDEFLKSRDEVTVKSGQNLAIGTVLAKDADGKVVILAPAANDGTQDAYGVLISPGGIDASATGTNADTPGVAIAREAILKDSGLVWPAGITDGQKATALDQLEARQINVRTAIGGTAILT